jgi:hypothetical protein
MTDDLARPLSGLFVGLSISESDDSTGRGFPAWQVNRVTMQFVAALMGQGAGVVFGHDWRDDGVMEAMHAFALRMQAPHGAEAAGAPAGGPLLQNLLPWPDEPKLSEAERERLASTLSVEPAGLPDDLAPAVREDGQAFPEPYLRARGLTHLRRKLNERTQARVCVGGRTRGSQGRYPGVIEEAFLSVEARQPLFLIGFLGGAARQVIDAVEGRPGPPPDFAAPTGLGGIYEAVRRERRTAGPDDEIDRGRVWSAFKSIGVPGLSESNKLTVEQNRELFHTPAVERAIQLVLLGLARIKAA